MKKLSLAGLLLLLVLSWVPIVTAQDSAPPVNRVSLKQARATSLRKFPGKVKDYELKTRNDKWVYAFKIAGKDQKMHRVIVDALTEDPLQNQRTHARGKESRFRRFNPKK